MCEYLIVLACEARDAPVSVLIGSKEPKPVEPIGTETGTD